LRVKQEGGKKEEQLKKGRHERWLKEGEKEGRIVMRRGEGLFDRRKEKAVRFRLEIDEF
jgi:hypothetical protein